MADIVYLSSGRGYASEYFDPSAYEAEAPVARRKAIEHYDAALRLTADPVGRTKLIQAVWRLRAGLGPLTARFVCVYD